MIRDILDELETPTPVMANANEMQAVVAAMQQWLKVIAMLHEKTANSEWQEMAANYGRAVRSAMHYIQGKEGELSRGLTRLWLEAVRTKQHALKQDTTLTEQVLKFL